MKNSLILFLTLTIGIFVGYYYNQQREFVKLEFFKCYQVNDMVFNPRLYGKMDSDKKFVPVLSSIRVLNPNADKLKEVPCEGAE